MFHPPLLPPCDIPHTFHHLRHFDLSSKASFYVVEVGMSYGPIASRSSPLPQNIHRFAQFFEFWIFHMYRILAEDFFSPKSLEGGINYSFTMLVTQTQLDTRSQPFSFSFLMGFLHFSLEAIRLAILAYNTSIPTSYGGCQQEYKWQSTRIQNALWWLSRHLFRSQ